MPTEEQCLELAKYDAACRALADAHAVDEVKDILDKAIAMRAYARQSHNKLLEIDASEIRFRAERRIGELMEVQRQTIGFNEGGRPPKTGLDANPVLTLAETGVDKNLAERARKYAAFPAKQFERLLADRRERIEKERNRVTIHLLEDEKAERRARREQELAARICALPTRRFGLIVADPEWRFEVWSRATGMDRAADNHYPTSELCDIQARDVASIAADDCALALWSTVPMLPQGLRVMDAWGFSYKTNFCWAKDRIGPGYWNRNKHEILLFGTKGNVPCPAPGQQWDSLQEAPRKGHSEKPEIFLEMLETYFPSVPKIELNRRGPPRRGWEAWGNEVIEEAARA